MAPDDTTITCVPRARAAAMSAVTSANHASRGAAPSTTSALPIFTTSSFASERRGVVMPLPSCAGSPAP